MDAFAKIDQTCPKSESELQKHSKGAHCSMNKMFQMDLYFPPAISSLREKIHMDLIFPPVISKSGFGSAKSNILRQVSVQFTRGAICRASYLTDLRAKCGVRAELTC